MLKKIATHRFLKTLEGLEYGSFHVVTPDGRKFDFAGRQPGPSGTLVMNDWDVVPNLITKGDIGFAEDYRDGKWNSHDLAGLVAAGLKNTAALESYVFGGMLGRLATRLGYVFRKNSAAGSRRNISAHYDLGNDFYQLWLDPSMTYSSALFKNGGEGLAEAQNNKYDRIIDHMETASGSVLEIGCGWGGFADRAMQRGDYALKGITLSNEQHDYARSRMRGVAEISLEDYRAQQGMYDRIVSIEMFEAVGEEYWPVYFKKLASLLKQGGKAVLQTITIRDDCFESYRSGGDMIRTFIFPGGMLPCPSRLKEEAAKAGLAITDTFGFGQDYAKTLGMWSETFENNLSKIRLLGFDDAFIRMWRLYLAACKGSFEIGRTDVVQMDLHYA